LLYGLSDDRVALPIAYEADSNFPNPFNSSTTIPYSVSIPAQVKIDVYNLRGQFVRQLIDAFLQPGIYNVIWDGLSREGIPSPSGIYLYRLQILNETAPFESIGRMTLIK